MMETRAHPRGARLVVLLAVAVALLAAPGIAAAATFIVTSNDDVADGTCSLGCNLRQAINSANATPGADRIEFAIAAGPQTITLTRKLPSVTDTATIDATTQPGYAGAPIIEIDGTASAAQNGLELVADNNTVLGLVLNRFSASAAIVLLGEGNTIQNNYVGTDLSGTLALPNGDGIDVLDSARNLIGGRASRDRNVIAGNLFQHVFIRGGFGGAVVEGNYIGVDATGSATLGTGGGVRVLDAPSNQIGSRFEGARNVISTGSAIGVRIDGASSTDNAIEGNYIGTDASGAVPLGNGVGVVVIDAPHTVVGGPSEGSGNVISASSNDGIRIHRIVGTGRPSEVQGNLIGTDATGRFALPNDHNGILVEADGTLIGGFAGSEANVISGNTMAGIDLAASTNAVVQGNLIGTDITGDAPLPNAVGIDVRTTSNGNLIGGAGAGEGNTIAFNRQEGVKVRDLALSNAILSNSIFDNGLLGIDLYPIGPNPNEPGDADTGPNDLQNAPTLTRTDSTQVQGVLDSHPNTTYRIQVFSSVACDPSGFGEGERLDAELFVTTDATGIATFTVGAAADRAITATATDPANNTSEFSNCAATAEEAGPGHVTGGGQVASETVVDRVSFGFTARAAGNGARGACDVVDHGTGTHVRCLDVTALVVTGTHAFFTGPATVNGVETTYRIEIDDLGEPGVGQDTFRIETGTGYAAGGRLVHGNVQIH